ncbi:HAMP domain-containing histidine kinase [Paenibacillus sp. MZ04-78.2]|uniref:histidine kinase dimerization/phospho-acceptor domain-containing protein n=1 Tax=Paenibacillus sp. MZ04-78.2 TaxID=2962034 RepID=UPI0020B6B607|nr:HAMP domain-containing sensor histidine kinase [Paenibacillus sp. MZ04-78.2]MCP3772318.1 HAMP domain-containing histidine kinase [Paenibacillus sp. MZ04-78.2]
MNRKGITLSKFWLTEESMAKLREGERVNKIYNQSKLKSSYLVNFFPVGGDVFAVGESISHSSDTIGIINRFNAYLWIGALVLMFLLCAVFAARIVKPLARLNETAEAILNLSFTKADIKTGDEIESLAHSINRMSDKLEDAHRALEAKNANLRRFISDISHELKTPLSLIQVYASGMKDGLDDGTYADVIRKQSEEMAAMVDRLLELSRLQTEPYRFELVEFQQLLAETLDAYRPGRIRTDRGGGESAAAGASLAEKIKDSYQRMPDMSLLFVGRRTAKRANRFYSSWLNCHWIPNLSVNWP